MLMVYYSPHAESTDNAAGRASGHADVPLSTKGMEMARELGVHYAAQRLDAVFCSDLQRAYTTSTIAFAARNIPIYRDARLREFDYGQRTQCPRSELALESHLTEPFPGGESITTAVERVGDFLREIISEYDGKTIAVIGHVATKYGLTYWSGDESLDAIVNANWEWRDIPIWHFEIDNPLKHTL